jgi:EAL domain-containing protein (putative c-di-GMP-specific phosphodiesterase class I)
MVLLKVCLLVSITLVILRLLLSILLNRATCPRCGYSLERVKRSAFDRALGRLLLFPIGRFKCSYYRCSWEGISIYAELSKASESEQADLAYFKAQGLQNLKPLEHSPNLGVPAFFQSEQDLRRSLEQNELLLYYQPRIDLESKDITGMEALLRWQHPVKGLIYPLDFIPLAEKSDLIFPIGEWIFETVCSQLQQWHRAGIYPLNVSINLSSQQFYHPHLARTIQTVLSATGLEPQCLEIEVAEATVMQYFHAASTVLRSLRVLGVQTAMDHFGLRSISLKQLQQLSLNTLKIDQSLIRSLNSNEKAIELIQSFIAMAQNLNLTAMAEGVENQEQLRLLRSLDCQAAQGYLFDRPLTADDATDVLQANWLGRKASIDSISPSAV